MKNVDKPHQTADLYKKTRSGYLFKLHGGVLNLWPDLGSVLGGNCLWPASGLARAGLFAGRHFGDPGTTRGWRFGFA